MKLAPRSRPVRLALVGLILAVFAAAVATGCTSEDVDDAPDITIGGGTDISELEEEVEATS